MNFINRGGLLTEGEGYLGTTFLEPREHEILSFFHELNEFLMIQIILFVVTVQIIILMILKSSATNNMSLLDCSVHSFCFYWKECSRAKIVRMCAVKI